MPQGIPNLNQFKLPAQQPGAKLDLNNFKLNKNPAPQQPKQKNVFQKVLGGIGNFGKQLATDIVSPATRAGVSVYDIGATVPHIFRAIGNNISGNPQGAAMEVQKGYSELKPRNLPFVGQTKPISTLKEGAGAGINAGLTVGTFGEGSAAEDLAKTGLEKVFGEVPKVAEKVLSWGKGIIPRMAEQGTLGAGFTGGSSLEQNKTPTVKQLATGFGLGALIPAVGTGLSAVKDKVMAATSENAGRVINSLIRPLLKDFSYGKNPGQGVANEGITFSTLEEGAQKIDSKLSEIGKQIGEKIDQAPQKTLDMEKKILQPVYDAYLAAKKLPRTNKELITRLEGIAKDLRGVVDNPDGSTTVTKNLGAMTLKDIFQFKKDVADVTKFTGNASDDQLVNKALKQVYGQAKETLNKEIPGLSDLNERFANLKSASVAIKYRDKIASRLNIVSLTPKLLSGFGLLEGMLTGDIKKAAAGGALGLVDYLASKPIFKTNLAKFMAKASDADKESLLRQIPGIANIMERIFGKSEFNNIGQETSKDSSSDFVSSQTKPDTTVKPQLPSDTQKFLK